ncbi:hypothetical protein BJ166DRAFT_494920 [Pestalotiopsis sp. NC0098]|nr:hypothetical protein BJ166DRAFT_494920 [Pestalotiopsis sp. NC0098]
MHMLLLLMLLQSPTCCLLLITTCNTKLDGQYYAGTCFICWLFTCSRYPDRKQVPYGGIVVDSLDAHERLAHGPQASPSFPCPAPAYTHTHSPPSMLRRAGT